MTILGHPLQNTTPTMVVISERKQEQEDPAGATSPFPMLAVTKNHLQPVCLSLAHWSQVCTQCSKGQNHHYFKAEHYPATGTLHFLSPYTVVHLHSFYHLPTASTQSTFSFSPKPQYLVCSSIHSFPSVKPSSLLHADPTLHLKDATLVLSVSRGFVPSTSAYPKSIPSQSFFLKIDHGWAL